MKWVKVAIGAVIAIISIGIIATSVHSMTQEKVKEEVVTFEVLTYEMPNGTFSANTFELITKNMIVDISGKVTNIISIKFNDVVVDTFDLNYHTSYFQFGFNVGGDILDAVISNDNTFSVNNDSVGLVSDDLFEITFEVTTPAQLTGITATLILLTPLIFAGGVLAYLLNKQNY